MSGKWITGLALAPLWGIGEGMEMTGNIVILTGAGCSAESGIDTFRDANDGRGGLWEQHRVEQAYRVAH